MSFLQGAKGVGMSFWVQFTLMGNRGKKATKHVCRPRGQGSLKRFPNISDAMALPLNADIPRRAPMQNSSSKQRWNDALHRESLLSLPSIVGRSAQPQRGVSFEQGISLEYARLGEVVDLPCPF